MQRSDAEAKGCGSGTGSSLSLALTGLALRGERDSDAFTALTRDGHVHLFSSGGFLSSLQSFPAASQELLARHTGTDP